MSGRKLKAARTPGFVLVAGLALAAICVSHAEGAKYNRKVDIGQPAPKFSGLMGVDGKSHSLDDYKSAKLVVIAFTCNQCPVSRMYEDRFIRFAKYQKKNGVVFLAISSSLLPPDNLDKMRERAKEKGFDYPYVMDATQEVGRAYGATVTPQVFVLDRERNIAYMGKFDDDIEPEKVQRQYVREAVHALLDGRRPEVSETKAKGCGIEYGKPQ